MPFNDQLRNMSRIVTFTKFYFGTVFKIAIPVYTDGLAEISRENRCEQVIIDIRDIRVIQRMLL